jgi:hypothetical protein
VRRVQPGPPLRKGGPAALFAEADLRHLICKEPQLLADSPQQLDISFAIVTEGEAATEINFLCLQPLLHYVSQKIFSANLGELFIETNDNGLFDTEYPKPFDFLIEGLQKRRRRFGMQNGARMWVESNYGWNRAGRTRPLHHSTHDQLMPKVQPIKYAERQHRRSLYLGVIGSVE